MSAAESYKLVQPTVTPRPAPRGVRWIEVSVAAARSGLNEGQIRRLCAKEYLHQGLAKQERPDGGGRNRWLIREDADARFGRVKSAADTSKIVQVPAAERAKVEHRQQILRDWQMALSAAVKLGLNKNEATARFLAEHLKNGGEKISRATLYNWHKSYKTDGVLGLVDGRAMAEDRPQGKNDEFADFCEYAISLWLNINKPTLTSCYYMAVGKASETGWKSCSMKTLSRRINSIPPAVKSMYREGSETFLNKFGASIKRDYSTMASNEQWVSDHHRLDVLVKMVDPKTGEVSHRRPWLTAWMDMRSRLFVGYEIYFHDPNSYSVMSSLTQAVTTFGIPEQALLDNGKDYKDKKLHGFVVKARDKKHVPTPEEEAKYEQTEYNGVFSSLGVRVRFCWPYHPQAKPIERAFRTVIDSYSRLWPTYTGSTPDQRPAGLNDRVKAGMAPDLETIIESFDNWIDQYHASPHQGDGMNGQCPKAVYEANLHEIRTATAAELALRLHEVKSAKVTANGVRWQGLQYGQMCKELFPLIGTKVTIRIDPNRIDEVTVWDLKKDTFICIAPCNEHLPANADAQDLKRAIGAVKTRNRNMRKWAKQRRSIHESATDLLRQMGQGKAIAAPPDPTPDPDGTPVIKTTFTDFGMEAAKVDQYREQQAPLKRAAGAETLELSDFTPDEESTDEPVLNLSSEDFV